MEDIKQANHKTFYEGENLLLEISGILDVTSTPKIWKETSKIIQESRLRRSWNRPFISLQKNGEDLRCRNRDSRTGKKI